MRIIGKEDTVRWLSAKGVSVWNDIPSFRKFYKALNSQIPADSGRKTAIGRALASHFNTADESLLWIHEFGIWPSSEDPNLFERFRQSLGEPRPLFDAPGHIFTQTDLKDVASLLSLVLYFIWGAVLYCPTKGLGIEIDHDEFITIFVMNKNDASKISEELKNYFNP
jgi:hypothetical protein